jgi:glutaminase
MNIDNLPSEILTRKQKNDCTTFFHFFSEGKSHIKSIDMRVFLLRNGFLEDDKRWNHIYEKLRDYNTLNEKTFSSVFKERMNCLIKAKSEELIIPEFSDFSSKIKNIFEECRQDKSGETAKYIPQLSKVDPEKYEISLCTIDGQRCSFGDYEEEFCIQSCSKPITYAVALETLGEDYVHKYVDKEPSGQVFNSMTLTSEGLPYNPMINSGAIMINSLIFKDDHPADKFDKVLKWFKKLSGDMKIGYNNSVYLSERQTADHNFALAYLMKSHGGFPKDTDIVKTLEFYFQCCSIEMNCKSLSIIAATLANGGVCPITQERVLSTATTRNVLSLMYSCGMYNYSGQFAFSVGLPAKSGVSGVIMLIVPGTCGICIWSPRLDKFGNSVRGIEFCRNLVKSFNFHNFDNLSRNDSLSKCDPRRRKQTTKQQVTTEFLYACMENNMNAIRKLVLSGIDVNVMDYDKRTGLHIAASEGLVELVKYLLENGADLDKRDRWNNTPYDDACRENKKEVIEIFENYWRYQSGNNIIENSVDNSPSPSLI